MFGSSSRGMPSQRYQSAQSSAPLARSSASWRYCCALTPSSCAACVPMCGSQGIGATRSPRSARMSSYFAIAPVSLLPSLPASVGHASSVTRQELDQFGTPDNGSPINQVCIGVAPLLETGGADPERPASGKEVLEQGRHWLVSSFLEKKLMAASIGKDLAQGIPGHTAPGRQIFTNARIA